MQTGDVCSSCGLLGQVGDSIIGGVGANGLGSSLMDIAGNKFGGGGLTAGGGLVRGAGLVRGCSISPQLSGLHRASPGDPSGNEGEGEDEVLLSSLDSSLRGRVAPV